MLKRLIKYLKSFKLFMSLDDFMEYPALSYNYLENADDDIIHIIEGDLVWLNY